VIYTLVPHKGRLLSKCFIPVGIALLVFWAFLAEAQNLSVALSEQEKEWLTEHRTFHLGVGVAFPPYMWVEKKDGDPIFKGMVSDYVDILGKQLDVDMQIVFDIPFNEALAYGRDGRIDFFPCLSKTPERSQFLLFSEPYLTYPLVIITREDAPILGGVKDLKGKRFAVVKHLVVFSKIQNDYPNLHLNYVFTSKVAENLEAVSLGQADACIINLAVASYYIQKKGLTNLRIAAPVHWKGTQLAMGVRKDWPILQQIIKKTLASISQAEKDRISQRWIRVKYKPGVDIDLIWRWSLIVGTGLIILFVVFFAWNRRLQEEVTGRIQAEQAMKTRTQQQAAISELGQKVLGNVDLATLMQEAVILVGQTLDVKNVKILKLLPAGDRLLLVAGVGWKEGLVGRATVDAGKSSQAGYSLISDEPVIIEDLSLETRFDGPSLLREQGIVSGLSVVIGERSHPFGVFGGPHRTSSCLFPT